MNSEVLKQLRTYEWDQEVIPGIIAVGTPGHSPGHTCHIVTSGASKVYVQGDVTHAPFLFVRNPGWLGRQLNGEKYGRDYFFDCRTRRCRRN